MQDSSFLFRQMWGVSSRTRNRPGGKACWDVQRDDSNMFQSANLFFDEAWAGTHCSTDWYAGAQRAHGFFDEGRGAPALLGFDPDILDYCGGNCDRANANILSLFGGRVQYNSCRNLEWQLCAAKGMLRGQWGRIIRFARTPSSVWLDGYPTFGVCSGWTDKRCTKTEGFANDDIFFLEVCLYSHLCDNRAELFKIGRAEDFVCELSAPRFADLKTLLLAGSLR